MLDQYKTTIQQISPEKYLAQLEACGWFADLPLSEHAALRERVHTAFTANPMYTFLTLATFEFDAECISGTGPNELSYYDMLTYFAQHSYGLFTPDHIHDALTADNRYIAVSFQHDGRFYGCKVINTDYFQSEILDLANQALSDSGIRKRFCELPAVDQCAHVAFVSEQSYTCAERHNLIPPPHYFTTSRDIRDEYLEQYYAERDAHA